MERSPGDKVLVNCFFERRVKKSNGHRIEILELV